MLCAAEEFPQKMEGMDGMERICSACSREVTAQHQATASEQHGVTVPPLQNLVRLHLPPPLPTLPKAAFR